MTVKKKKKRTTQRSRSLNATDCKELLNALRAAGKGDFSVRLSEVKFGEIGKEFNQLLEMNDSFSSEISRVGQLVGQEGLLNERASRARSRASGPTASTR